MTSPSIIADKTDGEVVQQFADLTPQGARVPPELLADVHNSTPFELLRTEFDKFWPSLPLLRAPGTLHDPYEFVIAEC